MADITPVPSQKNKKASDASRNLLRAVFNKAIGSRNRIVKSKGNTLIVESLEPRYMLSGDAALVPPMYDLGQEQPIPVQSQSAEGAAHLSQDTESSVDSSELHQDVDQVVFIDPNVSDSDVLVRQILQSEIGVNGMIELVYLDSEADGMQQVTNWLRQYTDLDALHFITHGQDGCINLPQTSLDAESLTDYMEELARWGDALSGDGDILLYGCSVAQTAAGKSFVSQLSDATGADVAASIDPTGAVEYGGDWLLEHSTGVIDAQALFDAASLNYDHLLADYTFADAEMRTAMLSALAEFDAAGNAALADAALNAALPTTTDASVNTLMGLSDVSGSTTAYFDTATQAQEYFTAKGADSTLTGLLAYLNNADGSVATDNSTLTTLLNGLAADGDVTGSWTLQGNYDTSDPDNPVITISLQADFTRTVSGLACDGPTLSQGGVLVDNPFTNVTANSTLAIDMTTGVTVAANPADAVTFFLPSRMHIATELTPTTSSTNYAFSLTTGKEFTLKDTNDFDHSHLIVGDDFDATDPWETELTAEISGYANLLGVSSDRVLFSEQVTGGVITLAEAYDADLVGLNDELTTLMNGAENLFLQVEADENLSAELPFASLPLQEMLKTEDGRTLSQLLTFQHHLDGEAGNVIDDYFAEAGAGATYSGLMAEIEDYLYGRGHYVGLVSVMPDDYSDSPFTLAGGWQQSDGTVHFGLGLNLSREFLAQLSFNDALVDLGFSWADSGGVPLAADIRLDLDYAINSTTINITNFEVGLKATEDHFTTAGKLGILETAVAATIDFQTSAVSIVVDSDLDATVIFAPGSDAYASWFLSDPNKITVNTSSDEVTAQITLEFTGELFGVALADIAGGTPVATIDYASGASVAWNEMEGTTPTVTRSNFEALAAISSLSADDVARMLSGVVDYLELLRDSGEFDGDLPFTDVSLGLGLDFSAGLSDFINSQLQPVREVIYASDVVSPVLTEDIAFDIQLKLPGDPKTSLITVTLLAAETSGFTHIDQLSSLLETKIRDAANGLLGVLEDVKDVQGDQTFINSEIITIPVATVVELVKGGVAQGNRLSNEKQSIRLHAAAGHFTLKVGAAGTETISLSVLSDAIELQCALEALPEIGEGNVIVTGNSKDWQVAFVNDLAGTDMGEISVSFGGDATAGGLFEVDSVDQETGDNGVVSGRLSFTLAESGFFEEVSIAPTTGLSMQTVQEAAADVPAIQRLYIIHAGGGSFTLSGTYNNNDFTTAAISLDGEGTWSDRIENALNAAMGLDSTTGVTVAATDPNEVTVSQGVQVFDITYGGTSVLGTSFELPSANPSNLMARPGVLSLIYTLQNGEYGVGETEARAETQRLVLGNVSAGTFTLGFQFDSGFYETDPIAYDATAADIHDALFLVWNNVFPGLDSSALTVTSVAGSTAAGGVATFDIRFDDIMAGIDFPRLTLKYPNLTPAGIASYANLTSLGFRFDENGSRPVTDAGFSSYDELAGLFTSAIESTLAEGDTFAVNPRYDEATSSILFDVRFTSGTLENGAALSVNDEIGDLSGLQTNARLDITHESVFEGTIGIDLATLDSFSVQMRGAYEGQSQGEIENPVLYPVLDTAMSFSFALDVDGKLYDTVTITTPSDGDGNLLALSGQDLLDAMNDALAGIHTTAGDPIGALGYDNLGEAFVFSLVDNKLALTTTAAVGQVDWANLSDNFDNLFGFMPSIYPGPNGAMLPENGQLSGDAVFDLTLDNSAVVTVTVTQASTADNTSVADLIADINDALSDTDISAHAYLGTAGLGYTSLAECVSVSSLPVSATSAEEQLIFNVTGNKVARFSVTLPYGGNIAGRELGITSGATAQTAGAGVFLQNVVVSGSYTGEIHGQDNSASSESGTAIIGMLDLVFAQVATDAEHYKGSYTYTLRNGVDDTNADQRISLVDLTASILSQTSQLGMYGDVSTRSELTLSGDPVYQNGQILRDVGLRVVLGSAGGSGVLGEEVVLDVVLRKDATLDNTSVADLAADLDAAIRLALTTWAADNGVTNPYNGTFVTAVANGNLDVLKFTAPTVDGSPVRLDINGRLLVDEYTDGGLVLSDTAASLTLSGVSVNVPDGVTAPTVTGNLVLSITNVDEVLSGTAEAILSPVLPDFGVLDPLKNQSWSDWLEALDRLPELLGDLNNMGDYSLLSAAIPVLGQSMDSIFDMSSAFEEVYASLSAHETVGLMDVASAFEAAFATAEGAVSVSYDAGEEALLFNVPYHLQFDRTEQLTLWLADPALVNLMSEADREVLTNLIGNIETINDADSDALLRVIGDIEFHLLIGVDLAETVEGSPNADLGKLFLADRIDVGNDGSMANDTGTFAEMTLAADGSGLSFESLQGLMTLRITGGSANVAASASLALDADQNTATQGRLYFDDFNTAIDASQQYDATDEELSAPVDMKNDSFDVTFSGTATASLPATIVVSDSMAQMAISAIEDFKNPMPIGTIDIEFADLANTMAAMGGAAGYTIQNTKENPGAADVISYQVTQAALPPEDTSGNGSGDTTPEGAPIDADLEGSLDDTVINPYDDLTGGEGSVTTPSGGTTIPTLSGAPDEQPTSDGFDISLVLPDMEYWQAAFTQVIESVTGAGCNPDEPENAPLLFLLQDPSIIVDTIDTILGGIQDSLDAMSSVLSLPVIGDALQEATQFVEDLRDDVVGAIQEALDSTVQLYGGVDNALRMFLYDILTDDNPFLNFLRDYNNDGQITPDDIVVEYLATGDPPSIDPRLAEYLGVDGTSSSIPTLLPGQRTAWVTSGENTQMVDEYGEVVVDDNGNPCYVGTAGSVVLDQSLQNIIDNLMDYVDSVEGAASALAAIIADPPAMDDALTLFADYVTDVALGNNSISYETLLGNIFGTSVGATAAENVLADFTASSTNPSVVLAEFKQALLDEASSIARNLALNQSSAIQFRMNLGQTFNPDLDLSFDVGIPGLNLNLDGGLGVDLDWDLYLGFGVDINDGFYLITNMPAQAGIGAITDASAEGGYATTVGETNYALVDPHIANLWLVGKPMMQPAVAELQFSLRAYLQSFDGNPAQLDGELLVLNGVLTDNWDGYIKDNDGGIWGEGATGGRTETMFNGWTGAEGSRTQFLGNFSVDFHDKSASVLGVQLPSVLSDGRLTYAEFRSSNMSDLFETSWDAQAQINLHVRLGIDSFGEGYLPAIEGDFHLTWADSDDNQNEYVQMAKNFLSTDYGELFSSQPGVWMTDVALDLESFFSNFMAPIVDIVQDVTDPIMPVIDAITTPIPGLSDLMGRDYSAIDLAVDMSKRFGGSVQVQFIASIIHLLQTIDDLPTDGTNMKIPVAEAFTISGSSHRQYDIDAIDDIVDFDMDVDMPYVDLPAVKLIDNDTVELGFEWGVGWKETATLSQLLKLNPPDISFDLDPYLNIKLDAPYEHLGRVVLFTVDGQEIGFDAYVGWKDLDLSDLLDEDGNISASSFIPELDLVWFYPDIDLGVLPPIDFQALTVTANVFGTEYSWILGPESVDWPDALSTFVDTTGAAIEVDLGTYNLANIAAPAVLPERILIEPGSVEWIMLNNTVSFGMSDLASSLTREGDSWVLFDFAADSLYSRFVDSSLGDKVYTLPTVYLPGVDIASLLPDWNFDFSLGDLISFDTIGIDVDVPGETTVTFEEGMADWMASMDEPEAALQFPVLDDPLGAVIDILTGTPTDLMTFTPDALDVGVGFEVSFPVYPPLYVGIGGSIGIDVSLTLGFDTYGIMKFVETHNELDILDGFYVSDNVIGSTDNPELVLTTKLYAFAELNAGVAKGGVEGGIKMVGNLDLCDPNLDGVLRSSEILSLVMSDPLDIVSMDLRGSAYISAYLKLLAVFKYVTVWEHTFMDETLFTWQHNNCAKDPILASMDGTVLTLHTGSGFDAFDGNPAIDMDASDRKYKSTDDGDENYNLTQSGSNVEIEALLPNGQTYEKTFSGVSYVKGYAGAGDDTFDASGLTTIGVYFVAGSGNDTLIGGGGADTLVGSDSGTAYLFGNGGSDTLIARGGTTIMMGGDGADTYRFIGQWGSASLINSGSTDAVGENILDFSAQTSAVTFDDAYHNAFQGGNTVVWQSGTTIDLVQGGSGSDIIDFSGDEANILVTLTGLNAGWATNTSTGMAQSALPANGTQVDATGTSGQGFTFVGIENIVGGQGSDVFRVQDGASVSGSLYGDTAAGLYHDTSGNENENARNTIDFSEFTSAVTVNLERRSDFGDSEKIIVRGFHNIFGGAKNDSLTGDGRHNLIVGNGGADTLAGQAGHDMLVADTFITYQNGTSRPANPTSVTDYLSLELAGVSGGHGNDGRTWIWKGKTIESQNLTGGTQTLKGGSGNDFIFGALGSDIINIGGAAGGNDTIFGDLGLVKVDFNYRSALHAETFGSGGSDTIYLGDGNNVVLAGDGNDRVYGMDAASSFNIVVADNGAVSFKNGGQVFSTNPSGDLSHMLDSVIAPVDENGGSGGGDIISLASGSAIVLGGAGNDVITFDAYTSTSGNSRFIAGDHAQLQTDLNGGVGSFATLDILSSTGGADFISVGNGADTLSRHLGRNAILGGSGSDEILISSHYNEDAVRVQGEATSVDTILGDNGAIYWQDSVYDNVPNRLLQIVSSQYDVGGNDTIYTANGDKVILGGYGDDHIEAATVSSDFTGNSLRIISGDNAQVDYDDFGRMYFFTTLDTSVATGGVDYIQVGSATDSDARNLGYNFIMGGMWSDTIFVSANFDEYGLVQHGEATSEDIILGDNGEILRTRSSATKPNMMLQARSIENSKGGHDLIYTGNGGKVIIAGYGQDTISALDGIAVVFGDNAQLDYDSVAENGLLSEAKATDLVLGADDTITLREGMKLVNGGIGDDTITINATTTPEAEGVARDEENGWLKGLTGIASTLPLAGLTGSALTSAKTENKGRTGRFVAGDNVSFVFDYTGGLTEMTTLDAVSATGGDDVITIGVQNSTVDLGYNAIIGGMGADTISIEAGTHSEDVIFGDNGEILRKPLGYNALSLTSTVFASGGADVITTGTGNKIVIGGYGNDTITLNTDAGYTDASFSDTLVNRAVVAGDSAAVTFGVSGGGNILEFKSLSLTTGGNDQVTIGDGDISFIGGYGVDRLTVNSNETAFRTVAGDNALMSFATAATIAEQAEALTQLLTLDQTATTGGGDILKIGNMGSISGEMGELVIAGGVGADTITISGASAKLTALGDNGRILREAGIGSPVISVESLLSSLGAGDEITTVAGEYILVGGAGADTIRAGKGLGVVFGDNAHISLTDGHIRSATSFDIAQGGNDTIVLGVGSQGTDDDKFVVGGVGADIIRISSDKGSLTDPVERAVAGDNATLSFDDQGRMLSFSTDDTNISTSGDDEITILISGDRVTDPLNPEYGQITDYNVVAGGLGSDDLSILGATLTSDVASGDNLDYRRAIDAGGVRQHLYAGVNQAAEGGNDTVRAGSGQKILFGGTGEDTLSTSTLVGDRSIIFGDSGEAVFDAAASGNLIQLLTLAEYSGDDDQLTSGAGETYLFGGLGCDSLIMNGGETIDEPVIRVAAGDHAQINFQADGTPQLIQTTGSSDIDPTLVADHFAAPSTGVNYLLGGVGFDTLSGSIGDQHRILPGSGSINPITNVVSVVVLGENGDMGYVWDGLYAGAEGSEFRPGTDFVIDPTSGDDPTGGVVAGQAGYGAVVEDRINSASGRILYPALEGGVASFDPLTNSQQGMYGYLQMREDGFWEYRLGEDADGFSEQYNNLVQSLAEGDERTEVFTVRTTDGSSTSVTIHIDGTTDRPQDGSGTVVEDGPLSVSGQIADNETAARARYVAQENITGEYGYFSLNSEGEWGYILNNGSAAVQALSAAETVIDSFTYSSLDGASGVVYVTISGVNDAATISGTVAGAITAGSASLSSTLTVTDVDTLEEFSAQTLPGSYGEFRIDPDGVWIYSLDNDNTTVLALNAGESLQEQFTITTLDGTEQSVTIVINGVNEAANIGGAFAGVITAGQEGISGLVTVTDVDNTAAFANANEAQPGNYGTFFLTEEGVWTYTLNNDNAAVLAMNVGDTLVETFSLTAEDGTNSTVTITINGINEAAEFVGQTQVTLGAADAGASGSFSVTDVDNENRFVAETFSGDYGVLTLTETGGWDYVLNTEDSTVLGLNVGDELAESFTLQAVDGTTLTLTLTITGRNEAAQISGDTTGVIKADESEVTGRLTVADVDNNLVFNPATISAEHGSFTVTASGAWTYQLNTTDSAVVLLTEGQVLSDTFTAYTEDGTAQEVTVTIQGVNDAATISGERSVTLTADDDQVTGVLSVTDVDSPAQFLPVSAAGNYGAFSLNAAGEWSYQLDTSNSAVLASNIGDQLTENFIVTTVDGTVANISVTITGINDAALISGDHTAVVSESQSPDGAGNIFATGSLLVEDVDSGEDRFAAQVVSSGDTLGSLTIDSSGNWSYSVQRADTTYLGEGETKEEVFTVHSLDGSASIQIIITLTGVDSKAVISGVSSGSVQEVVDPQADLTVSGQMNISDADLGQSLFATVVQSTHGNLGSLTLNADGTWTYVVSNSQVQFLGQDAVHTDLFTVYSLDGHTAHIIAIDIAGINNPAVVGGSFTADLIEDDVVRTTGRVSVGDLDAGEAFFQAEEVDGDFGRIVLERDGQWVFTLDNQGVQALKKAESLTQTFTFRTAEGTAFQITATVTGRDDAPEIAAAMAVPVPEQISVSDLMGGDDRFETGFYPLSSGFVSTTEGQGQGQGGVYDGGAFEASARIVVPSIHAGVVSPQTAGLGSFYLSENRQLAEPGEQPDVRVGNRVPMRSSQVQSSGSAAEEVAPPEDQEQPRRPESGHHGEEQSPPPSLPQQDAPEEQDDDATEEQDVVEFENELETVSAVQAAGLVVGRTRKINWDAIL